MILVVNFTPRLIYPRETTTVTTVKETLWTSELVFTASKKRKSLAPAGIRAPDSPTRCAIPSPLNEPTRIVFDITRMNTHF